ncbi:MAG: hypothetical protein IJZ72_01735 [Oscillospiraceae bacterium]|nr:hypothetical protein [Oscillospiraceae bacterium]
MFWFKKKPPLSEERKAAMALPKTKEVQYLPRKITEVTELLEADLNNLFAFEPVNYYASKETFLKCTFFYDEEYTQVYFVIQFYKNDTPQDMTPFYKADYALMKRALTKFGVHI